MLDRIENMATKPLRKRKVTSYLAIIFIAGGSSWGQDRDMKKAVKRAQEICERDWSSLFDLSSKPTTIHVYNASNATNGWYADHSGVYARGSDVRLPYVAKYTRTLKGKKSS